MLFQVLQYEIIYLSIVSSGRSGGSSSSSSSTSTSNLCVCVCVSNIYRLIYAKTGKEKLN